MPVFLFFIGLVLLIAGAEFLVRGASRLAAAAGISRLVIGLTVVAYGTSAPELVVSVFSSLAGKADVAVGNVVGSNIFNVLFILGISAIILPLSISRQLIRLDVPLMITVSIVFLLMALDGHINRLEAVFLLITGGLYTWYIVREGRRSENKTKEPDSSTIGKASVSGILLNGLMILAGLVMLVLGSKWLVGGALVIARKMGVSELVAGLVLVAAGTSLPEAATSIVAAIRKERDIAVGNIIGSNIFNILIVVGFSGTVMRGGLTVSNAAIGFDIPVMLVVAIACLPIFFTGQKIARWEGMVFFGYYLAYTLYLILAANKHDSLPLFSKVMVWFVVPLTVITLLVTLLRALRKRE